MTFASFLLIDTSKIHAQVLTVFIDNHRFFRSYGLNVLCISLKATCEEAQRPNVYKLGLLMALSVKLEFVFTLLKLNITKANNEFVVSSY